MTHFFRWKLLLLVLLCSAASAGAQVRVWQGILEIPVYEEGNPDPNPSFDQFASVRFNYPYTLRKEITANRVTHQLRAIYLENEYLKCSVLPDIGGHVYTCIDKISGKPMFYANPSIKKARIGYRGAWAAFGVEFNFPVSHNWMSMSPVDFAYHSIENGGASVTVGNVDRVYGMEWTVELILRPGSTVLEQRVRLNNRSDVRHRFYWWSNAGVEVWDDSRIEYPMRFAAAHGFAEVQPWPVDSKGRDLSIIKNQTDGPVSLFVHGSREEFMGLWNPHTNTGTAHFADYAALPAKKIWSWGVDADGLDWRRVLSDDNSAYAEVQGGLFRNQETYAFLQPRETIEFSEYWMPVRDTGGISRANLNGVVHLQRQGDALQIALNVNHKMQGARIEVRNDKGAVSQESADLSPDKTWQKSVHLSNPQAKYTFVLTGSNGRVLLKQTEGEYEWQPESEIKVGVQKNYVAPEEESRTEDDWLQAGASEELNGNLLAAVATYQKALQKFPSSFELMKAAGRLDVALLRFREAIPRLEPAHERNTTDAEISYYLAIAYDGLRRDKDAITSYEAAMRLPEYRAAATLRMGELYARQGNHTEAEKLLEKSRLAASNDFRAGEELAALYNADGNTGAANGLLKELLTQEPLRHFLREEIKQPDLQHLAADPYRVLSIAGEYARVGLYRKAIEVLSREYPQVNNDEHEPGMTLPQQNPLVAYFRGFCREQLRESGSQDYTLASRLSTLYVFPSTLDDKNALEAALRSNPDDATARYLLGAWYFARAENSEAIREWQIARTINPRIPALNASLGLALLHVQRDFAAALSAFEEGITNDSTNIVNYEGSSAAAALLGKSAEERVKILEEYPDPKAMPTPLVYELALSRGEAGDFARALELFNNRFFVREEGGTNVRQVWVETRLQQAVALAKHGQCDEAVSILKTLPSPVPGLDFTNDGLEPFLETARTHYLEGEAYAACARDDLAKEKFTAASSSTGDGDFLWAWAAARKLPGFNAAMWSERLSSAAASERRGSQQGWWLCNAGALKIAAGRREEGEKQLRDVLLLPDSLLSHHYARLALAGSTPR